MFCCVVVVVVVVAKYKCVLCPSLRLELTGLNFETVDQDGVLLGTRVVLVLDTDSKLELHSGQLADLAPVAAVQQHLVLQILAVNVLVEDLGHLLRSEVVQGVSLGRPVEGLDDSGRWGAVDNGRRDNLDHVVGITEAVTSAVGGEETASTADVDVTGNEGDTDAALLGDLLKELDELLLLLGVDVASPGVDHVVKQLGAELAQNVVEGLAFSIYI